MNRLGHIILSLIAVMLFAIYLPQHINWSDKELLVFYGSLFVFSVIWTPDIDLKTPFISHRGITHSIIGVTVIAAVLGYCAFLALGQYTSSTEAAAFTFMIGYGFVVGWMIHIVGDAIYGIVKNSIWIIMVIVILTILFYGKII